MDKTLVKNIEIHMIADKIHDNMAEFLKGFAIKAPVKSAHQITVSEIETGVKNRPAHKEINEENSTNTVLAKTGDDQTSRMIHGKSKLKTYEKLLFDGNKSADKTGLKEPGETSEPVEPGKSSETKETKELKLLSILDEIDDNEANQEIHHQPRGQGLITERPVFVSQTTFDANMLYLHAAEEPEDHGEDTEYFEEDDHNDESESDEESDAESEKDTDANTQTVSLKEACPGYFKSLVVKI
ncbi:MAG: hypothetical protein HQM16_12310 [Deltaproteobacteria bacterium]|nr:hypothetical protein [Deltaproteobacteria bacterium]